jgi:BlaI family transcriptional regulator, penicillinase repressor
MSPGKLDRLTRREREIVETLIALSNRAAAEEIRQRLTDPPSYSAVRALLARLEAKGCVRHVEEGPRYIYSATVPVRRVGRAALRQHLRVFWEGSRSRLIAALLRDEDWTDEELQELKTAIEQAQAGKSGRRSS